MTVAAEKTRALGTGVSWHRRKQTRETFQKIVVFVILSLLAILFVAPVLWMFSSSLKSLQTVFDPTWIPQPAQWNNYPDALSSSPFGLFFRNTIIVTSLSVIGAVVSSSLVAYSFARLRWPGRDILFGVVLSTMLLPGIVTLIPQYILFSRLHWVDTWLPLIVPQWLGGGAFYIFLLRQFYRGIPLELSEAARIDGASELRIWWQIIMPLARPALAAVTIFAFNGAWEDYFGPLIYLSDQAKWTLQLGLTTFEAGGGGLPQWNWMMAAGLVVMLPVIIVFFLGQRYFIEGVTLTGLKG